jgi:hypothetical protein
MPAGRLGNEPRFTNRGVKSVTFKGKLELPIHRWFRLTPSFSPELAHDIADAFGLDRMDHVLDPFGGVGTVALCMKYRGVPACSIELNPFLHFVGTVKTRTYSDLASLERCVRAFLRKLIGRLRQLPAERDATRYLREYEREIPAIHRPDRWWSPGNLMQLVCLRQALRGFDAEPDHHDLLKMGVLAILIPVSNARHSHVSLTFAAAPAPTLDVGAILTTKYGEMIDDLRSVAGAPCSDVAIHRGNSKELSAVLPEDPGVTAVITSPPYPNRFSYARETRPHLFFCDFVSDAAAVGQLETEAIGGTWGKATSVLAEGVAPANALIGSTLAPYTRSLLRNGPLMRAYVTKYFNDMFEHAGEIARICARRCRLAYVIGNSRFYGNAIPSDELVGGIFAHFGFALEKIDRMRRRRSKSDLYEAVVFMRRE